MAGRPIHLCFVLLFLLPVSALKAADPQYIGPQPCQLCHKDIAASQEKTAMANTWQGSAAAWLPRSFDESIADDSQYEFKRSGETLTYSVDLGKGHSISLPISISMGGRRHGLGFLSPIQDVEGSPLARRTLVQTRYAWSPEQNKLLISPGATVARPQSLESALGVVLSPSFESRCLGCHGQPNLEGAGKAGGVHCESCHGPGSAHLAGVAAGNPRQGIVNPKRLASQDSMAVCARCHVGLTKFADPSPDDLLIANQVRAIQNSECYLQSGKAFSCTTCHDPHRDSVDDSKTIAACLGCHSKSVVKHAAVCPVNATAGCVGCHMPAVDRGPLHLVDHFIRVHPEQNVAVSAGGGVKSELVPISEYLRMIALASSEAASNTLGRLRSGESFYVLARQVSTDPSSAIGGYLGRKLLDGIPMDLRGAAAKLNYGETSGVLKSDGRWVILQRLPRDFRRDAELIQDQAEALAAKGDAEAAIKRAQAALMVYPQFLRALNFIGMTYTQNGNAKKGASVLAVSARLYPEDATAEFLRASSLNLAGDPAGATKAYKQVISLEPDFTAAYLGLGLLSYSSNDWRSAIQWFREGLQIDPLSTELNYNLGMALIRNGDAGGGAEAIALAGKLGHGAATP